MAAIFQHHIDDMAQAIADRLQLSVPAQEQVKAALSDYWTDVGAITWSVQDILDECPGLSQEQAQAVLASICDDHDASIGVNWDTIRARAGHLFPDVDLDSDDDDVESD